MEKERFLKLFSQEIEEGSAAIFAGAGFSISAGFVNWRDLLRDIADELGLDVDRESDLVSVAQYHVNQHGGNRGHLNRTILEEFPTDKEPTENHRLLARLPISTWWTTNYDRLIERAIESEGYIADVKYDKQQLAHTKPRRDKTVYKMHGDVDHPASTVITRDDYEFYEATRGVFLNALAGDLVAKTFLFLGFSFSDPNLNKVLSHIRVRFRENQRPHYAIFKDVIEKDYADKEEFEYERMRQSLIIQDLKRFNINAIMIDDYSETNEIIAELYRRHVSKYVFVSSSAEDFSPWGEDDVTRFMSKLGSMIVDQGFRLVTGVGLGTGNAVMGGAIVAISSDSEKKLDHDIVIRPFPQHIDDVLARAEMWENYRKDMIGRVGIALFLFGNKEVDGKIVPSDGMRKEFEIAKKLGVAVVPIGATGSISKELAEETLLQYEAIRSLPDDILAKLKALMEPVGKLDQLVGPIMDILDQFRDNQVPPSP